MSATANKMAQSLVAKPNDFSPGTHGKSREQTPASSPLTSEHTRTYRTKPNNQKKKIVKGQQENLFPVSTMILRDSLGELALSFHHVGPRLSHQI